MKNSLQVLIHLVVREAEDAQPHLGQNAVAVSILIHLLRMDWSINFDHQPCGVAVKIDDEAGDDLLAAEVPSFYLVGAQALPEDILLVSHMLAQFASLGGFFGS